MPYYKPLKAEKEKEVKLRTIDHLLQLRQKIANEIPPKTARETLLLATWNIREFSDNRLPESLYYIAEIIDAFDFVAVQEVSSDLVGLQKLMYQLGPRWQYIVTDSTEGSSGGGERMAFLYDTTKVTFRNIAGEIVLPKGREITEDALQFARTPFLAAFQAGWFKFTICTVHIYYGTSGTNSAGMKRRVEEIKTICEWLKKKAKNENSNYILLGDFNIEDPKHITMKALEDSGFHIPEILRNKPTDLADSKFYDQIAFQVNDDDLLIFKKNSRNAGAFRFTDVVMRADELETYKPYFEEEVIENKSPAKLKTYYEKFWRTFQISDHCPLWVELTIDFSDEYLEGIRKETMGTPVSG
jgi:endonuclease/exonuclease/phosphatase family metal-dependent hydrolase